MSDEQIIEAAVEANCTSGHNARCAAMHIIQRVRPLIERDLAQRIAAEIEAQTPEAGSHINMTPRRGGLIDAYQSAARLVRGAVTPE